MKVKAARLANYGQTSVMTLPFVTLVPARRRGLLALCACLVMSACANGQAPSGISDRFERENRATHALNVALDQKLLRPAALGVVQVVPAPVVQGVTNFAGNLDLPGEVVNNVLQLRMGRAVQNTLRFAINTTLGLGGLFDVASSAGVTERPTDFGETLSVWGMAEGEYVELPFNGPSTQRDALGRIVDLGLDPLRLVVPRNKLWIGTVAQLAARIGDRGRYSDTVDSILYESADGYAQARLLYLENRRHALGQIAADSEFEDPYADQ